MRRVGAAVRYPAARRGRVGQAQGCPMRRSPSEGSGYIVLAMGKMGAFELNYSSDIDLIVFYDPMRRALADGIEPAALLRPADARSRQAAAGAHRGRLRVPHRPAAASRSGLDPDRDLDRLRRCNYYESTGQNWERAAHDQGARLRRRHRGRRGVPARARAVHLAQISRLRARSPTSHAMKRQIHAYRGHDEIAIEGHNIKLGRGGIREIEFFVQTQQLIAGGRHPELRGRETLRDARRRSPRAAGSAPRRARDLDAAYRFLRTIEHRLQMVADEQTHTLPVEREALERFARFLGLAGSRRLRGRAARTPAQGAAPLCASCSRTRLRPRPSRRALVFPADADDRETLDRLAAMGFRQPLEVSATRCGAGSPATTARCGRVCARASRRAGAGAARPPGASRESGCRADRVRSFPRAACMAARACSRCCGSNPDLVALVALTLGTAPRLADILARCIRR